MANNCNKNEDRTSQIIEAKATKTYIVVSDGKGGAKKIFAKDL